MKLKLILLAVTTTLMVSANIHAQPNTPMSMNENSSSSSMRENTTVCNSILSNDTTIILPNIYNSIVNDNTEANKAVRNFVSPKQLMKNVAIINTYTPIPELQQSFSWGTVRFYVKREAAKGFISFIKKNKNLKIDSYILNKFKPMIQIILSDTDELTYNITQQIKLKELITSIKIQGAKKIAKNALGFAPVMLIKNSPGLYSHDNFINLDTLELDEGLKVIGEGAFESGNFRRVVMPETLEFIDSNAFKGCKNLISTKIPKSVKSINKAVFSGCSNLSELSMPVELLGVHKSVFESCTSLDYVQLH